MKQHVFRHPKIATFFFAALFFMSIAQCTMDSNKASLSIKLPSPASGFLTEKSTAPAAEKYNVYITRDGKIVDLKENIVGSRYVVFGSLDEGTYSVEIQSLAQDGKIIAENFIQNVSLESGKDTSCSIDSGK